MIVKLASALFASGAMVCAAYLWWPAALLLAPFYAYLMLFRIFVPLPQWGHVDEMRTGPARWTPRGGDTQWLDGVWAVRVGSGSWHEVKMPSDLATLSGFARSGPLWFRRRFTLAAPHREARVFLGFLGIGGVAEVFVDGQRMAGPLYGFCPFEIEFPRSFESGTEHEVIVRVRRAGLRVVRDMALGPPYAAGLFRDVYVQSRPRVFIESVALAPVAGGRESMLMLYLNGTESNPVAVSGVIKDSDKKTIFQFQEFASGVDGRAAVAIKVPAHKLRPWSRFKPSLYSVSVSLVCGAVADSGEWVAGFKDFSIDPQGIMINGKTERLCGVRRAEHFPPYGGAFPGWAMKRDVELLKEALLNVVVNAHFPMHPGFLDVCDREGLYVVQELPVIDALHVNVDEGLAVLEQTMRNAEAHPCFLFWFVDRLSLRGSFREKSKVAEFLKIAHDRGRLVLSPHAADQLGISQPLAQLCSASVDVYNPGDMGSLFRAQGQSAPSVAVLDILDGRGGADTRHAREMRKAEVDQHMLMAAEKARVAVLVLGHMFGWGLRVGLISVTRKKKVSLDVVRDYLRNRTTGGVSVPAQPSQLLAKAPPLALLFLLILIVLLQPLGMFLLSWPVLSIAFISNHILLLVKETTFLIFVLSVSFAMAREPRYLFRFAGWVRFPVFLRMASRWYYRALAVGIVAAWCQALGFWLLMKVHNGTTLEYIGVLALASLADTLFAALLFARCPLGAFITGAGLVHGVLLAAMIPWPAALFFSVAAYGPMALFFMSARGDAY